MHILHSLQLYFIGVLQLRGTLISNWVIENFKIKFDKVLNFYYSNDVKFDELHKHKDTTDKSFCLWYESMAESILIE